MHFKKPGQSHSSFSFDKKLYLIYLLLKAFQKNWIPVSPHVGNFKVGGELENRCAYQKKSGQLTKTVLTGKKKKYFTHSFTIMKAFHDFIKS